MGNIHHSLWLSWKMTTQKHTEQTTIIRLTSEFYANNHLWRQFKGTKTFSTIPTNTSDSKLAVMAEFYYTKSHLVINTKDVAIN